MDNPFDGYNSWENAGYDRVRDSLKGVPELSSESLGFDRRLPLPFPLRLPRVTIKTIETRTSDDWIIEALESTKQREE
jgi:hypothetical protein